MGLFDKSSEKPAETQPAEPETQEATPAKKTGKKREPKPEDNSLLGLARREAKHKKRIADLEDKMTDLDNEVDDVKQNIVNATDFETAKEIMKDWSKAEKKRAKAVENVEAHKQLLEGVRQKIRDAATQA